MIETYEKASLSSTESSDSFLEVEEGEKASAISSESFVELERERDNDMVGEEEESEESVILREANNLHSSPGIALKQLESRFISAMEKLAELSSDKEQLEHLVERLQEETDTIGDYVIMYQHQRKQQRIKIQEKEQEVILEIANIVSMLFWLTMFAISIQTKHSTFRWHSWPRTGQTFRGS